MDLPTNLEAALAALAERLALARPLAFIDVETTGLNAEEDRVVDFGVLKLYPDGSVNVFDTLVDPTIPIPVQVSDVHGITNADVAGKPNWGWVGPRVAGGLKDCDLMAYNGRRLDLGVLKAEMARWSIEHHLDTCRIVDPFQLWAKREPRDLASFAARFGRGLVGDQAQHRAAGDVLLLVDGFLGMMDAMNLPPAVQLLHDESRDLRWIDPDGKLAWVGTRANGRACWTFGKQRGRALQDTPRGFLRWVLGENFSPTVKGIVKGAMANPPRYPGPPHDLPPDEPAQPGDESTGND